MALPTKDVSNPNGFKGPDTASAGHYLGKMAEAIAMNWLIREGHRPQVAVDSFDDGSDIKCDDLKYEVKCQVPFMTKNLFTFHRSQLKKLTSSDFILLISSRKSGTNHWSAGIMWLIDVSKIKPSDWYEYEVTVRGKKLKMVGLRTGPSMEKKSSFMEPVYTLTEKEAAGIEALSPSGWQKDNPNKPETQNFAVVEV